ncbi:MAG TPA: dihydroxyacetone kinase subunit DhaL [Luteimicrobium sp.]|jgi:dihydroxyacetone kinase-like protein|nr:dihydroxyacetone kinase subunit DhaL [Luteimicrobium sp.]
MAADVAWAERWVRETARSIAEHKDELTELDRQIGDGDHGENMNRGFTAVVAKLDALPEPPAHVSDVLKLVATTLMSTVGGAAGPLYGTAFLRASKLADLPELDGRGVVAVLEGALEGVQARGKATVGEKTMVDALSPAVQAAVRAADAGGDARAVFAAAAEAAQAGAEGTIPLLATKGRASYLGERSIGHEDPGAASTALVLAAGVAASESEDVTAASEPEP